MSSGAGTLDRVLRRGARPRRMLRVGAVAAAALIVALPAAGDTPSTQADSRQSQSEPGKTPPFGGDDYNDQSLLIQQTTTEVRKAKVHFVFPDVYLRANLISCFANADQEAYFGSDVAQRRCSELTPIPLPPQYFDPSGLSSIGGGAVDGYLVNHHGKNARNTYGSFPAVKVRALVFGSIPVSATVHLEQTVTNGYLDPIVAQYGAIIGVAKVGQLAYPGFPPAPPLPAGVPDGAQQDLTFKNSVDATLRLRVSDVAVDGRPVDVGSRCGTVSPVRLTVRETLGYTPQAPYTPRTRGLPGGFLQLVQGDSPGYFDGNANVPAFAGCGSPTEDLDPLLTALVSSPTNRVSGRLAYGALQVTFCSSPVADSSCSPAVAAAQRRMRALAVAIAAHKSPAEIRQLQAKLKPSDYVMPKVKASADH